VLHAIELIKHLSSVQASQRDLEAAINLAFHQASSNGAHMDITSVDREISRRRRARLPPLRSLPPSLHHDNGETLDRVAPELHYQTRRLGHSFSRDPTIVSDVISNVWASHAPPRQHVG
jgi:hypothetical protein